MLLAAGVYPQCIRGIAEVTTLRFRAPTVLLLGTIAAAAGVAIIALAGQVKGLVIDHRWVMYSLFIGLTLGGVPVVWRLLKPFTRAAGIGTACGIAVMAAMTALRPGSSTAEPSSHFILMLLAGVAGAAAMILPGISGSYLWLILGVYLTVLTAIEQLKITIIGTLQHGGGWRPMIEPLMVLAPLAIGVGLGLAGISNLMRMLLARFEKANLGRAAGLIARGGSRPVAVSARASAPGRRCHQGSAGNGGIHREDRSEGLSPGTVRPYLCAGRIVDRTGSGGSCAYTGGGLGRTRPSGVLTTCARNRIPLIDEHQ